MITEKQISDKADEIQKHIHKEVEIALSKSNCTYEDATNVCIYRYLAKLELMIEQRQFKETFYSGMF